jgi:hypothetical protein
MLSCSRIMLSVAALAWAMVACSPANQSQTPQPSDAQPSTPASTSVSNSTSPNWKTLLGTTPAPSGWQVAACDLPIYLCVQSKGESIGAVELGVYPIAGSEFEKMMQAAGDRSGLSTAQRSEVTLNALKIWVNNHYNTIKADRQIGFGKSVVFTSQTPEVVPVGRLQGLRYGFTTAAKPNSNPVERSLGYVASDGQFLYVMTTSVPQTDAGGTFANDAKLRQFEPYLQKIIAGLKLGQAS